MNVHTSLQEGKTLPLKAHGSPPEMTRTEPQSTGVGPASLSRCGWHAETRSLKRAKGAQTSMHRTLFTFCWDQKRPEGEPQVLFFPPF